MGYSTHWQGSNVFLTLTTSPLLSLPLFQSQMLPWIYSAQSCLGKFSLTVYISAEIFLHSYSHSQLLRPLNSLLKGHFITIFFNFTLFYFTILCWYCHTSTWIHYEITILLKIGTYACLHPSWNSRSAYTSLHFLFPHNLSFSKMLC